MPDSFFVSHKSRKRKRSAGPSSSAAHDASPTAGRRSKPFAKEKQQKRTQSSTPGSKSRGRTRGDESDVTQDDDMDGVDDLDLRAAEIDSHASASEDEDELETPAEKQLRLAKLHLQSVKDGLAAEEGLVDAAELDRELISSRLKQDVMEQRGKLHKFIADTLELSSSLPSMRTRGHRSPVTCSVASADGKTLFSAGKDGCIAKWDLLTGKQVAYARKHVSGSKNTGKGKGKQKAVEGVDFLGHSDEIWCLAISDDGRWLVSGGKERIIGVWDAEKLSPVKSLAGHRDSITGLVFRKGTNQLYSASHDRSVKLFDLSPDIMGYVETFFGHQDSALDIDALRAETAVTCGARDQTCRFWKVLDETMITYRGGGTSKLRDPLEAALDEIDGDDEDSEDVGKRKGTYEKQEGAAEKRFVEGSIDCVAMIDESTFVSGGDSGSISVWSIQKKKPVYTQPLAHGVHEMLSSTEGIIQTPRWITSLASLSYSDIIASGSSSGEIRVWKLEVNSAKSSTGTATKAKPKPFSLLLLGTLPAPGVVNSIRILSVPRDRMDQFAWAQRQQAGSLQPNGTNSDDSKKGTQRKHDGILIVAGLAQEPRLGRWIRMKEGGAANITKAFLLPGKDHNIRSLASRT